MSRSVRLVLCALLAIARATSAAAQSASPDPERLDLLGDLAADGFAPWSVTRLADRPTRWRIVRDGDRLVVAADSYGGNSALWRRVDVPADSGTVVSWRWKVAATLPAKRSERSRRGDDFAARVFVVFDAPQGPFSGRALCYVWAAREPVGARYPSPYSEDVAMVVVASGNERAGHWVEVERRVVEDFRRAFGEAPAALSGVAIMVDTDNTETRARAWFDRVVVRRSR